MSGTLNGRVAVVTGASRGIGQATAKALVKGGAQVVMIARTESVLTAAAEAIGGIPIVADIADPSAVERMEAAVAEVAPAGPDIVVNSAGAFTLASVTETTPEDFLRQLTVNVYGPFLVLRQFLPGMLSRRFGHVVNVGSVAGRVALPGNAAYGASKFGLRGMHEVLATELRGTGVRATLIEPAATDTPLWDPLDPDTRDDLPSRSAMLRPEQVARMIRYVVEQPPEVEVTSVAVAPAG